MGLSRVGGLVEDRDGHGLRVRRAEFFEGVLKGQVSALDGRDDAGLEDLRVDVDGLELNGDE